MYMYIHVYVYIHVCIHTYTYIYTYIYLYVYTYTYTYTYIYTYTNIYIYLHTYIHICICIYLYIYMYVHVNILPSVGILLSFKHLSLFDSLPFAWGPPADLGGDPLQDKSLSSAPTNQAPVPGCRYSSCVLVIHICLRVCDGIRRIHISRFLTSGIEPEPRGS